MDFKWEKDWHGRIKDLNATICIEDFCNSQSDIAAVRDRKTGKGLEVNSEALALNGFSKRTWQHATRGELVERLQYPIKEETVQTINDGEALACDGKNAKYSISQQNSYGHVVTLSASVQPIFSATNNRKIIAAYSLCQYQTFSAAYLVEKYQNYFSDKPAVFYVGWLVDHLGLTEYFLKTPTIQEVKWLIYSDVKISRAQLAEKLSCSLDMLGYYAHSVKNNLNVGCSIDSVREKLRLF